MGRVNIDVIPGATAHHCLIYSHYYHKSILSAPGQSLLAHDEICYYSGQAHRAFEDMT